MKKKSVDEYEPYRELKKRYASITQTNEELLSNGYQTGTPEYKSHIEDILVGKNIGLAIFFVGKYKSQLKHTILNVHDLVGAGLAGIHWAATKWDVDKKTKFSYYASYWIKQYMQREIDKNRRGRRTPVKVSASIRKVHERREEFATEYGHYPTTKELARYMRIDSASEEKLEIILEASRNIYSLDVVNRQDETVEPEVLAVDENWSTHYEEVEKKIVTREFLSEPLEDLTREKIETYLELGADPIAVEKRLLGFYESKGSGMKGLELYLEDGMTLEFAGLKVDVSKEMIRQSKVRAIEQIKERLGIEEDYPSNDVEEEDSNL